MTRDEVLAKLAANLDELRKEYPVTSLSIFGSIARDDAATDSDVDILVEFSGRIGLFGFYGLQLRLEELLGCKVDLGTPRSLRPCLRDEVLREAIRVA